VCAFRFLFALGQLLWPSWASFEMELKTAVEIYLSIQGAPFAGVPGAAPSARFAPPEVHPSSK